MLVNNDIKCYHKESSVSNSLIPPVFYFYEGLYAIDTLGTRQTFSPRVVRNGSNGEFKKHNLP